ncbi:NAD(P)-dependent oxidoreductase [Tistrella mobilis]|uniref:NAD-dependent epimerase/dehydratase family protein n=1 Tax=Tistrella mobilis TaxID=171437 RepID=UPI003555FD6C
MTTIRADATRGPGPKHVAVFGTGQIGTFTIRALRARGHAVSAADRRPDAGYLQRFGRHAGPVKVLDIRDAAAVADFLASIGKVDALISAAGMTGGLVAADPDAALAIATTGTRTLLDAAAAAGIPRVVVVSSLAVYGPPPPGVAALAEDMPARMPPTAYGRILAAMERVVADHPGGLDRVVARVAGVYGPNRYGHGSHSSVLVERMLFSAAQGYPLRLQGDAGDTDDLVYVEDVGEALARAAAVRPAAVRAAPAAPGGPEVVNVGTGGVSTVSELIDGLGALFGGIDVTLLPPDPPRPPIRRIPLATGRLDALLGLRPRPLAAGLRAYLTETGFAAREPAGAPGPGGSV